MKTIEVKTYINDTLYRVNRFPNCKDGLDAFDRNRVILNKTCDVKIESIMFELNEVAK